jgi:uncharacterized protein YecE (DUF72 family)
MYPLPRPRGFDPLAYVSSYLNLVEINSTFYRIPTPATCRRWLSRVAIHPHFLFTAKAHQAFTHRDDAGPAERTQFLRAMEPLQEGGRLGAVLLQFPWSFRFDAPARQRLHKLAADFQGLPLAVEVRHAGWESDDAQSYLAEQPFAVCGIDQPVIGESLRPYRYRAGPAGAYFRFHGRNYRNWFANDVGRDARYDYLYRESELSPWADVIRVFVVLNNHFRGQGPANAFDLAAMLLGRAVPAPAAIRRAFPSLAPHTTVAGGASDDLFGGTR